MYGQPGFNSQQGLGLFLLATVSTVALGPTHPPIQWMLGVPSLGVKWPWCKCDHLPASRPDTSSWCGT